MEMSITEKIKCCLSSVIFGLFSTFGFTTSTQPNNGDARSLDRQSAISELRSIRESGHRESERVVELWNSSIAQHIAKLGHEKWAIFEQVFIASLDISDVPLARGCLNELQIKFKDSCRVNRLSGMYLEKMNRFADARALYTQLIADDPTNTFARKRLIAISKAEGKNVEAIQGLLDYLKIFMGDFEAWSELAELYLGECDYKHAAFCMEELLLSNPHNHLYCQRYAEIKYTEGGTENLEIARTYFAQACQLSDMNLRSLFGLLLTCSALDTNLSKSFDAMPKGLSQDGNWEPGAWQPGQQLKSPVSKKASSSCPACSGLLGVGHPLSDGYPTAAVADGTNESSTGQALVSSSEQNRRLAVWAKKQIDKLYQANFADAASNTAMKDAKLPRSLSVRTVGSRFSDSIADVSCRKGDNCCEPASATTLTTAGDEFSLINRRRPL